MDDLTKEIIDACETNSLFGYINDNVINPNNSEKLINKIIKLHNEGLIDAIFQFSLPKGEISKSDFFKVRHVFENFLPSINHPVLPIMTCVKQLANEAANDIASNQIHSAFIKFCEKAENRPNEVYAIAIEDERMWSEFISLSFVASINIDESKAINNIVGLFRNRSLEISTRAIYVLSRLFKYHDRKHEKKILDSLEELIQERHENDKISAAILKTTFTLLTVDENHEEQINRIWQFALKNPGEITVHQASEIFIDKHNKLTTRLISLITDAIKKLKSKNNYTINNIDHSLSLRIENDVSSLKLLEYFICEHDEAIDFSGFKMVINTLGKNSSGILNKVTTRWLASRKIILGSAVTTIFKSQTSLITLFDDKLCDDSSEKNAIFLTKKTIAWLYHYPLVALIFIKSIAPHCSDEELKKIQKLAFDTLVTSNPNKVQRQFEEFAEATPNENKFVKSVLEMLKSYYEEMKEVPTINELHSSIAQKESFHHFINKLATKVGDSENFIGSALFPPVTVLYGRKAVVYTPQRDSGLIRQEINFKTFSSELTFPQLEVVAPHELTYMLRKYKVEGCEQ